MAKIHASRRERPKDFLTPEVYSEIMNSGRKERNFKLEFALAYATSETVRGSTAINQSAVDFLIERGVEQAYAVILSSRLGRGSEEDYAKMAKNFHVLVKPPYNDNRINAAFIVADCQKASQGRYLSGFRRKWDKIHETTLGLTSISERN